MPEPLLLDTHVWLWLMQGDARLSRPVVERIEVVARDASAGVPVSAISVWEVGMLEAKGRISLNREIRFWVTEALSLPGVSLTSLTPEVLLDASRLPGDFHGDPADRMLVATARRLNARLVTHDTRIRAWASAGYVAVLEA